MMGRLLTVCRALRVRVGYTQWHRAMAQGVQSTQVRIVYTQWHRPVAHSGRAEWTHSVSQSHGSVCVDRH